MQPGDVVKLKSGSAPMTIEERLDRGRLACVWYSAEREIFESRNFEEAALEVVTTA